MQGHRVIRVALIIPALALAATGVAACGGSSSSSSTTASPATGASTAVSSTAATPAAAATLTIESFAFHPASLTVAPGATVTVHNADKSTHTVTASGASKGAFDTGDISPGATATFSAPTKPGSYTYICNIHQFMMGTLIVS